MLGQKHKAKTEKGHENEVNGCTVIVYTVIRQLKNRFSFVSFLVYLIVIDCFAFTLEKEPFVKMI